MIFVEREGGVLKRIVGSLVVLVSLAMLTGCQKGDDRDLPATVEASGVVTLDGQPVEGASVVFIPSDGGQYPAQGLTDSSGRFSLQAFEEKSGAVPGKYAVQVSKTVTVDAQGNEVPPPEADESSHDTGNSNVHYVNKLPKKYASMATSGLQVEIPAEGISDIKLELVSDGQ